MIMEPSCVFLIQTRKKTETNPIDLHESSYLSLTLWKLAAYFQFSFNFPIYCIFVENGICIRDFVYEDEELLLATSVYAPKVYLSCTSCINSSQIVLIA